MDLLPDGLSVEKWQEFCNDFFLAAQAEKEHEADWENEL